MTLFKAFLVYAQPPFRIIYLTVYMHAYGYIIDTCHLFLSIWNFDFKEPLMKLLTMTNAQKESGGFFSGIDLN